MAVTVPDETLPPSLRHSPLARWPRARPVAALEEVLDVLHLDAVAMPLGETSLRSRLRDAISDHCEDIAACIGQDRHECL